MSKEEQQQHITSIGGQAVMEGVMMRGPFKTAVAVRKPDGDIECKVEENGTKTRKKFWRLPIIRGCVSFVDSLVIGMKALMFSAEFVDIEEEEETESKFDKWLDDKFGDKIKDIVIYVSIAISLVFSIALFMVLPTFLTKGAEKIGTLIPPISAFTDSHLFTSLFEGIIRMVAGEELTVENIKKHTRFHPRCGTSFLLFVMIVSILLFALLPRVDMVILRVLMRLALLPAVAGISFEIIKFAGRSKSKWVAWLSKPGLWLQKLTTREPDASQIEVAIESMKPCIPENKEDDRW